MIPKIGDNFSLAIVNEPFKDENDERFLEIRGQLDKYEDKFDDYYFDRSRDNGRINTKGPLTESVKRKKIEAVVGPPSGY